MHKVHRYSTSEPPSQANPTPSSPQRLLVLFDGPTLCIQCQFYSLPGSNWSIAMTMMTKVVGVCGGEKWVPRVCSRYTLHGYIEERPASKKGGQSGRVQPPNGTSTLLIHCPAIGTRTPNRFCLITKLIQDPGIESSILDQLASCFST